MVSAALQAVARSGLLGPSDLFSLASASATTFRKRFPAQCSSLPRPVTEAQEALLACVFRAVRTHQCSSLRGEARKWLAAQSAVDGLSPLHVAVISRSFDSLSFLLSNGASPNVQDVDGVTPLHIACSGRFLAAVPLLLLHGACPLVLDAAGVDSATLAAGTRAYASFQPVAAVMFGMEPSSVPPACGSCLEAKPLLWLPSCGHSICTNCLRQWLQSLVKQGKVLTEIRCFEPECPYLMHPNLVKRVAEPSVYASLEAASVRVACKRMPGFMVCGLCESGAGFFEPEWLMHAAAGAGAGVGVGVGVSASDVLVAVGGAGSLAPVPTSASAFAPAPARARARLSADQHQKFCGDVTCNNGHLFCQACGLASHSGQSCAATASFRVWTWAETNPNVRRCPKCAEPIEKNGGCNSMYCTACKTGFQWPDATVVAVPRVGQAGIHAGPSAALTLVFECGREEVTPATGLSVGVVVAGAVTSVASAAVTAATAAGVAVSSKALSCWSRCMVALVAAFKSDPAGTVTVAVEKESEARELPVRAFL